MNNCYKELELEAIARILRNIKRKTAALKNRYKDLEQEARACTYANMKNRTVTQFDLVQSRPMRAAAISVSSSLQGKQLSKQKLVLYDILKSII